jgi:hypothetical protein
MLATGALRWLRSQQGNGHIAHRGSLMSYLNPLRLHFSGSFEADVSTVNNDPTHFDNDTFLPSYQERPTETEPNGWWNPRGSADWRLRGCAVTSAFLSDGSPASRSDAVRTAAVADSAGTAPAKLVDLDSEQQLVSTVWGLKVRLATPAGDTLLQGQFEPAAFTDIWMRNTAAAAGDMAAGAMYHSVLTDLSWGDTASPFLRQLRAAAGGGKLSIKFNVDAYNMNFQSGVFATGRLVGTIGPAISGEPDHFVAGRQFLADSVPTQGFFEPVKQINFCAGVLDRETMRFYLDLGNALPTGTASALNDLGDLSLSAQSAGGTEPIPLGILPASAYTQPSWYSDTAGVILFPPDRPMTEAEFAAADSGPLALACPGGASGKAAGVEEAAGGLFVRADQFVFRLSPGDTQEVSLYATRFGRPYPGAAVAIAWTPEYLQVQAEGPEDSSPWPSPATPAEAVGYERSVLTDASGVATLHIAAGDPGTPRGYIDGQVYALYPALEETLPPEQNYLFDPANFISLLIWSGFQPEEPPTWNGSIHPILLQYANLYPIMGDFVSLGRLRLGVQVRRPAHARLRPANHRPELDAGHPGPVPGQAGDAPALTERAWRRQASAPRSGNRAADPRDASRVERRAGTIVRSHPGGAGRPRRQVRRSAPSAGGRASPG